MIFSGEVNKLDYTQADINSMRRDALRRTREMHSHALRQSEQVQEKAPPLQDIHDTECKTQPKPPKKQNNPINTLLSGLFTGGKIDNDKIIIILLIILLAREGADLKLLIALGYILM